MLGRIHVYVYVYYTILDYVCNRDCVGVRRVIKTSRVFCNLIGLHCTEQRVVLYESHHAARSPVTFDPRSYMRTIVMLLLRSSVVACELGEYCSHVGVPGL